MIADIEKVVNVAVFRFLEETSKEFDIPFERLKENWRRFNNTSTQSVLGTVPSLAPTTGKTTVEKNKSKTSGTSKKSAYQNYFALKRNELKKDNPELSFGELSTRISSLWKNLSKQEQERFGSTESAPAASVGRRAREEETRPSFTFDGLNGMTMCELKKLCESRGLSRTGNKKDLIHTLLRASVSKPETVPVAASVDFSIPPDMEDLEVVVAKNQKRVDIEEEPLLLEDEHDFEFEEDDKDNETVSDGDVYDDD